MLGIFKARKYGMGFWGVKFWFRDFLGIIGTPRDSFWY